MNSKVLRVVLAALLTVALVPTAALADEEDFRTSYEPEGYHDEGAGETSEDGDSWRITDGVPNSVWLEENEDAGIMTLGAFSDVGDDYRATWSAENGVGTYIDRKKPSDKGTVITVPGAREVGVDISYFNNEKGGKYSAIDWNKMKADGITFAIIRIGDGGTNGKGFNDPWFVQNIQGAKAAGIKVGAYLFSRATHLGTGDFSVTNEINQTLNQLKAAGITPSDLQLPVYLDLECQAQRNLTKKKGGAELLGQIAVAWCGAIQAAGYNVGIYANTDWFNSVLTDEVFSQESMAANQWSRWVARYSWGGTSSNIAGTDIWQFTSIGLVSGTPRKYCDVNFAYVDFGSAPKVYTAKYKLNGGTFTAANPVSYVDTLKLPTPTRAGYKFDGWYTDAKFTTKVTKLTRKNATLYAKWSQPYKIKYVLNKGKNNKANPAKYGGTVTLKNPTRSGYTFLGWYTDKKFKKKVTKLSMTKNRTVYAKWAKLTGGTYRVSTPGGLYIRATPSTSASIRGGLANGETVRIVKIKGDWGRLADGRGWIKLSYAKRV